MIDSKWKRLLHQSDDRLVTWQVPLVFFIKNQWTSRHSFRSTLCKNMLLSCVVRWENIFKLAMVSSVKLLRLAFSSSESQILRQLDSLRSLALILIIACVASISVGFSARNIIFARPDRLGYMTSAANLQKHPWKHLLRRILTLRRSLWGLPATDCDHLRITLF